AGPGREAGWLRETWDLFPRRRVRAQHSDGGVWNGCFLTRCRRRVDRAVAAHGNRAYVLWRRRDARKQAAGFRSVDRNLVQRGRPRVEGENRSFIRRHRDRETPERADLGPGPPVIERRVHPIIRRSEHPARRPRHHVDEPGRDGRSHEVPRIAAVAGSREAAEGRHEQRPGSGYGAERLRSVRYIDGRPGRSVVSRPHSPRVPWTGGAWHGLPCRAYILFSGNKYIFIAVDQDHL